MKKLTSIIILSVVVLIVIYSYEVFKTQDGKLHIIFCDVGQGDAILVRTPSGSDILIDAGPNSNVLQCLKDHMPFYDKKIELFILSHPHSDHFVGFFDLIKHYTVGNVASEALENDTAEYIEFKKILKKQKIPYQTIYKNDHFKINDGVIIKVLGPSKEFINLTSPDGMISESGEFASLVLHVSYGNFDVILTGDVQAEQLAQDIQSLLEDIEVLQVPHHGSKSGLNEEIIKSLNPDLAVISVGKNRYGHPTKEVLKLLEDQKIRYLRTDQEGSIEIITEGTGIKVKTK